MSSERLIFTDLVANNNKFWHADLNGSTLTCHWGRVGDGGQKKTFTYVSDAAAQKDFDSKVKAKLKKGYTRQHTMDTAKPVSVEWVAKVQIEHDEKDKETAALIDFLLKRNIHRIEGLTNIRMEAGQLSTPLGPVTLSGLDEAQKILNQMVKRGADLTTLANNYMRIVPQKIGRQRISATELFGSKTQLEQHQATLDSLRMVVKDAEQKASTDPAMPVVFQTKLEIVAATDLEFKKIDKAFRASLNSRHTSSRMKLHKVWAMQISSAAEKFEANLGNVKRLWHGTTDGNLLSILKGGLIVPGRSSGVKITGRMFGDGIYFSDQSTKSLNYATGYWGNGASNRAFMLLNDVAMGREFLATRPFSGGCPRGYDSTFARAGHSGVMNNEMIIYRSTQANPRYLCEFR